MKQVLKASQSFFIAILFGTGCLHISQVSGIPETGCIMIGGILGGIAFTRLEKNG